MASQDADISRKRTYPSGFFARTSQANLLRRCLAPWPRRGRALLDINCGNGNFLHMLWESGFDVLATCKPGTTNVIKKNALRFSIEGADDTNLPYDDGYFDWAILHLQKPWPEARASITEAMRVAGKGIAITFWNAISLPFLLPGGSSWLMPRHNWWLVWRYLVSLHTGPIHGQSTLFFSLDHPMSRWFSCFCKGQWHNIPFGAWAVLRIDFYRPPTVTPMPLRIFRSKLPRLEPVMECQAGKIIRKQDQA